MGTDGAVARYPARLASLAWQGLAQLVRPATHSRRAEGGRRVARHTLMLMASVGAAVVLLMYLLDATEIRWMPPRGTPSLWPLRIITDFGKSNYVLLALLGLMLIVLVTAPRLGGAAHATLIGLGMRLQFIFLAVLLPVLVGDLLKGIVGRGRPFLGGEANAFKFAHFAWTESYASFPSGHAVACSALAFAVGALWPGLRVAMIIYALVILATRLVLLAHHPSDVVAGALLGVLGAMAVRYWFAARRLAFVIRGDGGIAPRHGPSFGDVGRAARRAFAFDRTG